MAPLMSIRKKLFDELSDQFVLTVAKQFCQLAVCELDSAVEVDNEDAIRVRFNQHLTLSRQCLRSCDCNAQPMDEHDPDSAADKERAKHDRAINIEPQAVVRW